MATLGVEAIESDPVPAGVVPNCRRSRGDRNPEVLRAKRPSRPHKQHLRPSKGRGRRHVADRRIEERFSGSQAAKHERSNVFYQSRTRHRARQKHRSHVEWRSVQLQQRDRGQSGQPGRRKSSSAHTGRSKRSILNHFWLLCNILVGGCFGGYRKPG